MSRSLAAVNRKVPPQVQAIFDRYITDGVAKRLKKDEALAMLEREFGLALPQAEKMFDAFDQDKNGIMSIWEFQQFYVCVGDSATEMVEKFLAMDADGSGKLDLDEAVAGLKAMNLSGGKKLDDREITFFLKSTVDSNNMIDLGEFAGLLYKLKLYEKKKKK